MTTIPALQLLRENSGKVALFAVSKGEWLPGR